MDTNNENIFNAKIKLELSDFLKYTFTSRNYISLYCIYALAILLGLAITYMLPYIIVFVVLHPLLNLLKIIRNFKSNPNISKELSYLIKDNFYSIEIDENNKITQNFSSIYKVAENNSFFILFFDKSSIDIIPKKKISTEQISILRQIFKDTDKIRFKKLK